MILNFTTPRHTETGDPVVPARALTDALLNGDHVRILAYIITKPHEYNLLFEEIRADLSVSEKVIQTALSRLQAGKYITKHDNYLTIH